MKKLNKKTKLKKYLSVAALLSLTSVLLASCGGGTEPNKDNTKKDGGTSSIVVPPVDNDNKDNNNTGKDHENPDSPKENTDENKPHIDVNPGEEKNPQDLTDPEKRLKAILNFKTKLSEFKVSKINFSLEDDYQYFLSLQKVYGDLNFTDEEKETQIVKDIIDTYNDLDATFNNLLKNNLTSLNEIKNANDNRLSSLMPFLKTNLINDEVNSSTSNYKFVRLSKVTSKAGGKHAVENTINFNTNAHRYKNNVRTSFSNRTEIDKNDKRKTVNFDDYVFYEKDTDEIINAQFIGSIDSWFERINNTKSEENPYPYNSLKDKYLSFSFSEDIFNALNDMEINDENINTVTLEKEIDESKFIFPTLKQTFKSSRRIEYKDESLRLTSYSMALFFNSNNKIVHYEYIVKEEHKDTNGGKTVNRTHIDSSIYYGNEREIYNPSVYKYKDPTSFRMTNYTYYITSNKESSSKWDVVNHDNIPVNSKIDVALNQAYPATAIDTNIRIIDSTNKNVIAFDAEKKHYYAKSAGKTTLVISDGNDLIKQIEVTVK